MGARLNSLGKATQGYMERLIGPFVGRDDLSDAVGYRENAGPPTSVVPHFVGERLFDTTNSDFYMSTGVTAGAWALLASGTAAGGVGAINAATGLSVVVTKVGPIATLTFTMASTPIVCTDATTSGSSGSLKIFDFVAAGIQPISSRQDYTAITNASAQTTAAGDMAQVLGLGSVAADAGDGALTGTEVDFAPVTGTLTATAHVAAGTKFGGAGTVVDGTATAADLYLNWSGTAATSDANGTTTVTGTITLVVSMLGDD